MTVYNDQISAYITSLFAAEDQALQHVRAASSQHGLPGIEIKAEEGRFLQVLVRACNAQKVLEIGTLGGYSSIWLARGLPPGGRLITLELEPRHAALAQENFAAAGVAAQIEIRQGNAHQLLDALSAEGPFDFVFIDAEKPGYPAYLDWALNNVRIGGLITAHNALRKGSVAGTKPPDEHTQVTQAFNQRVASDPRLLATIFPAGDGTLLAVRVA